MIQHPIVKRKIHFLPYNTDFRYCLAYIHYLSQWLVRCVYVRYCFHLCLSSLLLVLWFCHNFKPKGSNAYTWHDRHAHTHTHIVYFEKKTEEESSHHNKMDYQIDNNEKVIRLHTLQQFKMSKVEQKSIDRFDCYSWLTFYGDLR